MHQRPRKGLNVTTMPLDSLAGVDDLPSVGERITEGEAWVELYGQASLPTRFGHFAILVFRNSLDNKEHLALVRGKVHGAEAVPVRVHSECLTGDALGSLRCDCRAQLELALETFGSLEQAVLVYMRQEGRGIGLGNKIKAYALQEAGLDTYEANEHLGFDADLRDYRIAALILRMLGVGSVELGTNNPRKVFGLNAHGVKVVNRTPVVAGRNAHNETYLASKAKSGHFLP